MGHTTSTRWYFADWLSDTGLRTSSLAARGLWIDLLALCASNKGRDYGFVILNGRQPSAEEIARFVGGAAEEVKCLLGELSNNGVFSVDKRGVIYSRRMVKTEKHRRNGRLGGNPKLLKPKENPDPLQPHILHNYIATKKEKNIQKKKPALPEVDFPEGDWLTEADRAYAVDRGFDAQRMATEFEKMKNHAAMKGRRCRDWHAAWRNWITSPYQKPENGNGRNGRSSRSGSLLDALDKISQRIGPGEVDYEPNINSRFRLPSR